MVLAPLNISPSLSTDNIAWRVADYNGGIAIPTGDIRWGTAATSGARTWFHIDSMGLLLEHVVKCGKKIWIFIRDEEGNFLHVNAFKNFELDEANGYQLEAVLLMPGTRL